MPDQILEVQALGDDDDHPLTLVVRAAVKGVVIPLTGGLSLEVRQSVEEDDRTAVLVAVEQGKTGLRFDRQRGADEAHDRGDA